MHRLWAPLALIAFVTAPLHAQTADRGTFGVGVRVTSVLVLNTGFFGGGPAAGGPSLLFPIAVSDGFRVEPEFGFRSSDANGAESSQFTVGLGVLPVFPRGDFTLYTGARVRYAEATDEVNFGPFGPNVEQSTSGFGIAPVVGGEHHFSRWFSLGGEAGLEYASFTTEDEGVEESDFSSLSTQGSVFIRFYFN